MRKLTFLSDTKRKSDGLCTGKEAFCSHPSTCGVCLYDQGRLALSNKGFGPAELGGALDLAGDM